MQYPKPILDLIDSYSLLPGIGKKTAVRLAFHTLKMHDDDIKNFADSLVHLKEKLTNCEVCGRLSEDHVCDICSDAGRDKSMICVVANDNDLEKRRIVRYFPPRLRQIAYNAVLFFLFKH